MPAFKCVVCRQWIFRPLTFSLGAVLYEQYTSLSACQDACMYDLDGCVAIDVGRSLTQCWVHYYNNTRLVSNINWPNVDQYALTDCFLPRKYNCVGLVILYQNPRVSIPPKPMMQIPPVFIIKISPLFSKKIF